VIECDAVERVVVVKVAWREAFSAAVPSVVAPSRKVTVPVGVPEPGLVTETVAVNVTLCPGVDGLADDTSAVVVAARPTDWFNAAEALVTKAASPAYVAVIECEATESEDVVKVATPEPFRATTPSVVAPSVNVTLPVGIPVLGALAETAAVNVTDWPDTAGLTDESKAVVVPSFTIDWVSAVDALVLKLASPE
jgi:hypothetical protein